MKHKIKILITITCLIFLAGCFANMTPSEKTEEFLNRYIKNDQTIISELDTYISKQNLSNEQKAKYKSIILDEYATIKYTISDEYIEDDHATVKVLLDVKDLYKASISAEDYLIEHPEEFYTDDAYDKDKFTNYKLQMMEEETERINHTIEIKLLKKEGTWTIEELDNDTLEKIHGIYDYNTNP